MSDQASKQSARAQELRSHASAQGMKLASIMEGIGALLGLLGTALEDESFAKDLEAAAEAQTVLENDSLGIDAEYSGATAGGGGGGKSRSHRQRRRPRRGLPSAAERVRAAPHRKRTSDEKRWVALDAVMNPKMYHHVTLAEAEEMRWDTLYYTRLDRDDIVRVLALPTQIQLALPFLHTPAEVDAHELLGRYTLGVGGDHFARLDKNSQDACITGSSSALAKKSETASEEGAGAAAAATATAGSEEVDVTTVPRRVLACMRRGVEAQLKLSTEQSEDEAVWLVLDRKLRSLLYQDEDDAAGEQNEELHREADAKEDARHTWLVTGQKKAGGDPGDGALGSVVEQPRRSLDTAAETSFATAVVGQRESQEDLATRMASTLGEHDVKRLALRGLLSDSGRAGPTGTSRGAQLSTLVTVSATEKADDDQNDHRNDLRNDLRNVEGGVKEAGGLVNANESWIVEGGDEKDGKTFAGGGVTVSDGRMSALESSSSARNNEYPAKKDSTSEQQETGASKKSLEEAAHHVMSRFFVREEETPLGRCMTRSLAVLQEVTLRLCRGQRDVFSGLNEQTAYAILLSSSRRRTFGEDTSASGAVATATTPTNITARVEELGIFAPNVGNHPPVAVTPTFTGAENTSVTSVDKAPSPAFFRASTSGSGSRSDSTNDGTGRVHARGSGGDGTCIDSEQAAAPTPSCGAIQSRVCRESRNSTGHGGGDDGREEVDGAGGSTLEGERKIFGSWEEVHPASLGIGSQERNFLVSEVGEGIEAQAHPASFRSSASEGITHTYYQYG